jgi:iron complex transport system substrate-binding protein
MISTKLVSSTGDGLHAVKRKSIHRMAQALTFHGLFLLMTCLWMVACSSPSSSKLESEVQSASPSAKTSETTRVTFTDSAGRKIALASPVKRAIVVYSQLFLAMKAIGVEDSAIIGLDEFTCHQYADIFPSLREKPTIGRNMFQLDSEKTIHLDPQVLLTTPTVIDRMPELAAQLERAGIKIVCLDFTRSHAKDVLQALGKMFARQEEAEDFSRFWFSKLDIIDNTAKRIPSKDRIKVYWENTNTPFSTINKSSAVHEILKSAGGDNIAQDLIGNKADPEWIITRNPGVIIKYPMGAIQQGGFGQKDIIPFRAMREEIMRRPGFSQINAVKTGRVYLVSQLIKTGLFENVAIGYIAKILYPELFKTLDPSAQFREMVEKYLRLDFKKVEGVFVYPAPWDSPAEMYAR